MPVDVPAWWVMKWKNTMFHTAAGHGDHARMMMSASILCIDDVAGVERIDAGFPDVRAYISSIEPPAWPFGVDQALADEGQIVFEATCARCHGTYGADRHYPNLWIEAPIIGTDPILAIGASNFTERFVGWFNDSFFGQLAHLDPKPGYVAPPLDGIWASAPYFHNGSVPTVAQVIDSTSCLLYTSDAADE